MSDFEPAFDYAMSNEDFERKGTVTKEPNGGIAKYGINSKAHTGLDIASLTFDQAKEILRKDYWDHFRLIGVASQQVASKLFDTIVNMKYDAVKIMQRIVGVKDDGGIGTTTLAAINKWNTVELLKAFCAMQAKHYEDEAKKDSTYPLAGLLVRAAKLPQGAA
jgi:lysozyme family protein